MTMLERGLARALLAEVVIGLDHSDDNAIAPEAIMPLPKPVISLLEGLSARDRRTLVGLIIECSPETLGLVA